MAMTLQEFLATGAEKASADLEAALMRVPEDKRTWSPMGDARTALDQIAECAILNGSTADIMASKVWPQNFDFAEYEANKAVLAQDSEKALALLRQNVQKVSAAIRKLADEDLTVEIQAPWGPMTLTQTASYPYWNMCYHEGQINYIASMLGCLS